MKKVKRRLKNHNPKIYGDGLNHPHKIYGYHTTTNYGVAAHKIYGDAAHKICGIYKIIL